jgi:hypothetical protein
LIRHVAGLMKPWILDLTVYEEDQPRQWRLF